LRERLEKFAEAPLGQGICPTFANWIQIILMSECQYRPHESRGADRRTSDRRRLHRQSVLARTIFPCSSRFESADRNAYGPASVAFAASRACEGWPRADPGLSKKPGAALTAAATPQRTRSVVG